MLSRLFCRTYIIIDEILVSCIINIFIGSCIDVSECVLRFIKPLIIFRNLKNKEMNKMRKENFVLKKR